MQIHISPVFLLLFFVIGLIVFVFITKNLIEHEQLKEKINNLDEIEKDNKDFLKERDG